MTENIVPFDRDQQLIERIKQLMANPPEGSVVLEITPGLARHVMQFWHGKYNRHEKPRAIKRYTIDIGDDAWMLNGSTVVFTDRKVLGDGQNRMMACIRANKNFKTHVIFGVPHEYFFTMDQGRVRTPADILKIFGVSNSTTIFPAVRWAELLATKRPKAMLQRTVFTPPEILKLYKEKHKAVEDWQEEARAIFSHHREPKPMVMALLYTLDKIDPDLTADFAEAWASPGSRELRFRPLTTLEDEIDTLRRVTIGRINEIVRMAMFINTWNAVRAGLKGRSSIIRWDKKAQDFPEIK